jgi:hypothetical protein
VSIRVGETYDLLSAYRNSPTLPGDFSTRLARDAVFGSSNTTVVRITGLARALGVRVGNAVVTLDQRNRNGYQWRVPISVVDTVTVLTLTRLDSLLRGLINPGELLVPLEATVNLVSALRLTTAELTRGRVTFSTEDPKIVSVQNDSLVIGRSLGETRIVMRGGTSTAYFGVQVSTPSGDRGTRTVAVGDTITLDTPAQNAASQQRPPSGQAYRSLDSTIARVVGNSRVVGVNGGRTRVVSSDSANPAFWNIVVMRDTIGYGSASPAAAALAARDSLHRRWDLKPTNRAQTLRSLTSVPSETYGFVAISQLESAPTDTLGSERIKRPPRAIPVIQLLASQRDQSQIEVLNRQKVVQVLGFASRAEINRAASARSFTLRTTPSSSASCPVVVPTAGAPITQNNPSDGTVSVSVSRTLSLPRVPSELRTIRSLNLSSCFPATTS